MIKKILRFLVIFLVILLVLAVSLYVVVNKPLPNGTLGPDAEQLADEMLAALNKEAYDSLEYIEFVFRNEHHHEWNRANNSVIVKWADQEIYLDLNRNMESFSLLELKAYEFFINDSFWVVAPFKIRDQGVIRSTVDVEGGRGLLVTYSSGGLTPGDSYLWILDERGFPTAWKLWTSNVPLGGLEFSWDGWAIMNEVWFSNLHEGKFVDVPVQVLSVR